MDALTAFRLRFGGQTDEEAQQESWGSHGHLASDIEGVFSQISVGGDLSSSNWNGANPADLTTTFDAAATVGFYWDSSAGSAQMMGSLWIGGSAILTGSGAFQTGTGGDRIVISAANSDALWFYDGADIVGKIAGSTSGYGLRLDALNGQLLYFAQSGSNVDMWMGENLPAGPGLHIVKNAESAGGVATTPHGGLSLTWDENAVNLGLGEGTKVSFQSLLTSAVTYENAYIASYKINGTDTDTSTHLLLATRSTGDASTTATPRVMVANDGKLSSCEDASVVSRPVVVTPVGSIVVWPAAAFPTGWLHCNGQAVSRTTYAALFAVISTTYGVGDGSTTFNVPDLRQRFPLGVAASGTGSTLAGTGGDIDHLHSFSDTATTGNPSATEAVDESNPTELVANNIHTHDVTVSGNTGTNNPPFMALHYIIRT
jgi:microcystin-dependent protein